MLLERALVIDEKVFDPDDGWTNLHRLNLAMLLLTSGSACEALAQAEAVLASAERTLGANQPFTARSAKISADALDALGRSEEAAALRERYGLQATSH